jgi:hypothetical protein
MCRRMLSSHKAFLLHKELVKCVFLPGKEQSSPAHSPLIVLTYGRICIWSPISTVSKHLAHKSHTKIADHGILKYQYSLTQLKRHRFIRHFAYRVSYSVFHINSSLLTITLRFSVITTLVYNDTKYSDRFMTL